MKPMIAIASDHAGFELKALLKAEGARLGFDVSDLGPHDTQSVDYPDFADALVAWMKKNEGAKGVLICGSGIGMSIAANRHKGIRAALCHDRTTAELARRHNDANVLCLGARLINADAARECLKAFLSTEFEGGRHNLRLEKME